jgi:hypothetical protein
MDSANAYIYDGLGTPAEQVNLSTGATTYLDTDLIGSVRGIVSAAGSLTATTAYDAWGNPQSAGGLIRPEGITGAIREVIRRPQVTDEEIAAIIGPPDFLTGCKLLGDMPALVAGRPVTLTLQARITLDEDHRQVVVENIPPNVSIYDARNSVADRASLPEWAGRHPGLSRVVRLPVEDIREFSPRDSDRFVCIPEPGVALEQLRDQLEDVDGISTTMPVALPQPLPGMVRQWAAAHGNEDVLASMTALEDAIAAAAD